MLLHFFFAATSTWTSRTILHQNFYLHIAKDEQQFIQIIEKTTRKVVYLLQPILLSQF